MMLKSKFSKDKQTKVRLIKQIIHFALIEDEKHKEEAIKKIHKEIIQVYNHYNGSASP